MQNENVLVETASLVIPGLMYASVVKSAHKQVQCTACLLIQAWQLTTDEIFFRKLEEKLILGTGNIRKYQMCEYELEVFCQQQKRKMVQKEISE